MLLARRLLFWADAQPTNRRIMTAWMDGTNIHRLTVAGQPAVTSMTVDEQLHRLYWADSNSRTIMSINIDGTDLKTLLRVSSFRGIVNSLSVFKVCR